VCRDGGVGGRVEGGWESEVVGCSYVEKERGSEPEMDALERNTRTTLVSKEYPLRRVVYESFSA